MNPKLKEGHGYSALLDIYYGSTFVSTCERDNPRFVCKVPRKPKRSDVV